jgi:adenylate kinase
MSLISQEDIELIKQKNPQLFFIFGYPGTGQKSQIEKVCKEFRYGKVNMKEVIKKEIENNTELGEKIKIDSSDPEVLTAILIKELKEVQEDHVFINQFPLNLEQALFFEQNVFPIETFINFKADCETCYKRIQEKEKDLENKTSIDDFKNTYDDYSRNINKLIEFYEPYGIMRYVDASKSIGEVNNLFKQNLYPIVYSIIGKRYAGKTEICKLLNNKTGINYIDFNDFLKEPEICKRLDDSDYVVSQFILKLRKMRDIRVLIEDFPQNEKQYNYFVNNCRYFEKIYYLNADNSSCLQRLNDIPLNDPNYTNCSKLDKMLFEFEQKLPFIDKLKKTANLVEIDVNSHKVLTLERTIKQIQPYCAIIIVDGDQRIKEESFKKLIQNFNFKEIDLLKIIEKAIKRKFLPEGSDNTTISLEEKINLIRPLIFREGCERVILNAFPANMEDLYCFEDNLCPINRYVLLTDVHLLTYIKNQDSMPVYFHNLNKLIVVSTNDLTDYKIEESLELTRDINIVYGMPMSGKTTIAKHLQSMYKCELLDFKELIEKVKKSKADPENPDAEVEITFDDLVKGLKDYLNKTPLNTRIVIDNIFIPNQAEPFLIDTFEKAMEIVQAIGSFRNFYEIDCEELTLINRFKAKEGIAEEFTEEQKNAYSETQEKPKKLIDEIRGISSNIIKVKCDDKIQRSKEIFDFYFGRNLILVKHDYDISIEKTLQLFATRNRALYVNVPKLIYHHFYECDEYSKRLEASYGRKEFKVKMRDPNNFEESVFYKYNPIHFEKTLVNEIVLKYIIDNYKIIENTGNFIIMSGYLNYDLYMKPIEPYNLPLLEIKNTMELGDFTALIQMSREEIKQYEDEVPEELVIEKPQKKVKKEGEEGEENKEEEPPEEENPDGPKFKPEDFKWTNYDGLPRNYVQILKRLKQFPVKCMESENCREELVRAVGTHIDNFNGREDSKYNGVIEVVKIIGEPPLETVESVNATSKIIESKRDIGGGGKGGQAQSRAKAIGIPEIL